MNYSEKLKSQEWLEKREYILQRDNNTCQSCHEIDESLQIHHKYYDQRKEPWDYDNRVLVTLCVGCHATQDFYRKKVFSKLLYKHFEKAKLLLIDGLSNLDLYNYLVLFLYKQPPISEKGFLTAYDFKDEILRCYALNERPENSWDKINL